MDLTVNEAAIALEKSPRAVRYMIARGQLKAVRRGRVWLIKRTDLPLDDAQASRARRRSNRIRRVVESALGDALPDAPSASDSRRKPKGERKERKPITVRDLRLYHLALELHESVVKLELPSDGGVRQPAPEVAFLEGIRALCVGYYHYDRRLKCDAYVRARLCFARSLSDLMVLLGSGGVAALPGSAASADVEPVEASLEQETSSAKTPAEAGAAQLPPPERSPPTFESLILKVESELMPALGRLLNRTERMR